MEKCSVLLSRFKVVCLFCTLAKSVVQLAPFVTGRLVFLLYTCFISLSYISFNFLIRSPVKPLVPSPSRFPPALLFFLTLDAGLLARSQ
jgi:hypothetical protein